MKKSIRFLLTAVVLSVAFASPVFATEQTLDKEISYIDNHVKEVGAQISAYLTTDDGCDLLAKSDHAKHAMVVDSQMQNWVKAEEDNFIDYLRKVVVNKEETERIKKQNLDSLAALVLTNTSLKAQYNAAAVEYNNAVLDRMNAQAAIAQAQMKFQEYNLKTNLIVQNARVRNMLNDK